MTSFSKQPTKRPIIHLLLAGMLLATFSSCGMLYPNRMLDTGKDFVESSFLDTIYREFVIEPGDQIQVFVYPNGGYNLIESQISNQMNYYQPQTMLQSLSYQIDGSGMANLPRLGLMKISGLTESGAEKMLTTEYGKIYTDAFVNVVITGKYITVYRGGSDAKQLALNRSDLTLLEAIGMAGGIPENGRSSKIKVIRNIQGAAQLQEIDLSSIDDIALGNMYIQPNDIIYIEPNINSTVFQEIGPILSTISSIAVIYAFFANVNQ
ncbi:MAG TPA: polysaccharide biosynthesis/export family protein [Chitinophagales bacterium]|nr:polysaccharide biosynthesis/export family protein [Chitinophagales bacterium]HNM08067.1 polysaccharide biosynthesis/export family protein [Chitinophagales bacterium]